MVLCMKYANIVQHVCCENSLMSKVLSSQLHHWSCLIFPSNILLLTDQLATFLLLLNDGTHTQLCLG